MDAQQVSAVEDCGGKGELIRLLAGDGGEPPITARVSRDFPIEVEFAPGQDHRVSAFTVLAELPDGSILPLTSGDLGELRTGERVRIAVAVRPSALLVGQAAMLRIEVLAESVMEIDVRFPFDVGI
ncbi:MAG TPA: hypothetical protein VH372_13510 [Actinospica sp.]|nr:hypothetical protein [Actinospica sp.]